MIFEERPPTDAIGALVAHSVMLGARRVPKGTRIDAVLARALREAGCDRLWIALSAPDDVTEGEAARRLAAALEGPCVKACPPTRGRADLVADVAGLFRPDAPSVDQVNMHEEFGIATRAPLAAVAPGQTVATVKVVPFAVPRSLVDRAVAAARPLSVAPFRGGLSAALLITRAGRRTKATDEKPVAVTRARLERLGVPLAERPCVAHDVGPLAQGLRDADGHDLCLVAGAAATSDRRDVVPAAIEAAGGRVIRVGMPVDPGNLLVLGALGGMTVIGLPGCARSPARNGLDLVLERWAAGLALDDAIVAGMGVGGLLAAGGRARPWGPPAP